MSEPVAETTWGQELAAAGAAIDADFAELHSLLDAATSDDALDEAQIADLTQQVGAVALERNALQAEVDRLLAEYEPPPPPPPEPVMRVGATLMREGTETTQDAYDRRSNDFGAEPEMVRYFFSGLPFGVWPQFGLAQSIVSFKPASNDVSGVAAGTYDAQISAFLDTCAADKKPKRFAFYHEREDNIERGEFTKAQARAADVHVKQLVDAANARHPGINVRFGIVLMSWTLDSRSQRNVADYLPAADAGWKYDWIGWDAYPGDTPSLDLPALAATNAVFQKCADTTKAHNAKANWFITETGTRNHVGDSADVYDTKQADWITGAIQVAIDKGCKGFCYFDSTVGGDFRIKGPKAKAAMGAAIVR